MGQPYAVQAGFPVQGLAEITPFADQEAGTSADMLNVLPFDSSTGRLRGGRRPGIKKLCESQINGTAAVQSVVSVNATYVEPVLGDATAIAHGNSTSTTEFSFRSTAAGASTDAATTYTFLGAVFGPPDNDGVYYAYAVEYNGTNIYVSKYKTDGTRVWSVLAFTASAAVLWYHLCGLCVDEDTIYVWYRKTTLFGEVIMRFRQDNGDNRDATVNSSVSGSDGAWVRAEAGITHTEKVFAGVDNAGPLGNWHVVGSGIMPVSATGERTHPCMQVFAGKLAVVGAAVKGGGLANEFELVVYVIDVKTGIVDAVVDFGLDGIEGSVSEKGQFIDMAFGLDGFIYVVAKDVINGGTTGFAYLQKISITGVQIWQIATETVTDEIRSVAWNNKRKDLVLCGYDMFGPGGAGTGKSVVCIDPDSKGITDSVDGGGLTRHDLVRCDGDGNIWLWQDNAVAGTGYLKKLDSTFTQLWSIRPLGTYNTGCCLNSFFNSGTDEAGSTRLQYVYGVSNGTIKRLTIDGASAYAVYNPGSLSLATNAETGTIYAANFGVLTFFADGKNHRYLDASSTNPSTPTEQGEMRDWAADVRYGKLPEDRSGGFGQIEVWSKRVVVFGLNDDPSNWYMSAKGDPFDWKIRPNVDNAAISGRNGPVGLYPEKITAVIPYNDDFAIFGGDSSIYQLSRDPAVDGVFDLISENIGIAPGRAWCRDGFGGIFFMGNNGGIYKLSLDQSPQRMTVKSIDARLDAVDVANSTISMAYDIIRQGVWVLIRPSTPVEQECYFLDLKGTEGWFPIKFGSQTYNPRALSVIDLDSPKDQKVLLGSEDGYVRYFSSTVNKDDGTAFDAYFVLGPWTPREGIGSNVLVRSIEMAVGGSGQSRYQLLVGSDAEDVITDGKVMYRGTMYPKRTNAWLPQISGGAVALKVIPEFDGHPQFEAVRMLCEDTTRVI